MEFTMYAWIGEDERGGGKIGIKGGFVPAGYIPLVCMGYHLDRLAKLLPDMEEMAAQTGIKRRLMKFTSTGEIAAETKAGEWPGGGEITGTDMEEFMGKLTVAAHQGIIPKMKNSTFCFLGMDGPDDVDVWLALQLGLALSLDIPLVVVATRNAPVSAKLRQIADVIVEGESVRDPDLQQRLSRAIAELMRKRGTVQ